MTWLTLLAAGLGGGVAVWLLDQWVTSIRGFETARLLLIAELTMIASALELSAKFERQLPLPTTAWDAHRHILARPIVRRNSDLWARIAVVYSSIAIASHLGDVGRREVQLILDELANLRVGALRYLVAYGPGATYRRWRERSIESAQLPTMI